MYLNEYKRWLSANLIDFDLHAELASIENDEEAIKERFAVVRLHRVLLIGLKHRVEHKLLRLVMTAV